MHKCHFTRRSDQLLLDHLHLFTENTFLGPVLDLAGGDCRNGILLARKGLPVICCDVSKTALNRASKLAAEEGVRIHIWQVDLEQDRIHTLPENYYGGILIFRYLYRPLIPFIRKALKNDGIMIYETFTLTQRQFGKPHNPKFLLKPGELRNWFQDWEIIHYFEGIRCNPDRGVAQIVCRKKAIEKQS